MATRPGRRARHRRAVSAAQRVGGRDGVAQCVGQWHAVEDLQPVRPRDVPLIAVADAVESGGVGEMIVRPGGEHTRTQPAFISLGPARGHHEVDRLLAEEQQRVAVGGERRVFAHVARDVEHLPLLRLDHDFGEDGRLGGGRSRERGSEGGSEGSESGERREEDAHGQNGYPMEK